MGTKAMSGVNLTSPIIDAEDTDLSAFKRHGGKLLQYHGWEDQNIPPRSSIRYFKEVQQKMGDTADFYRLFLVPGMLHCGGGPGPNRVDWLSALDGWVSLGKAVDTVTATSTPSSTATGEHSLERQLLCPYPQVARPLPKTATSDQTYVCQVSPSAQH
jgi:feruloyl esterase